MYGSTIVPRLNLQPRGMTALYDAIGRTVHATGKQIAALPESERPGKVLVVILTDGEENASQRFTASDVAKMIQHQQEVYSWGFIFLGANQDAILTAQSIGIGEPTSMTYSPTHSGTDSVFKSASLATSSFRQGNPVSFTEEQRSEAMDE